MDLHKTHYTVMDGDSTAEIGQKSGIDSNSIKNFELGTRNQRVVLILIY